MLLRSLGAHLALLLIAAAAALVVWTRDKKPTAPLGDVTVWSNRSADVQRISYESKGKKVSLEARKDALGRWFVGRAETPPPAPGGPRVTTFVSVGSGEKITDALGPLRALREVGKVGPDRAGEFGLAEPEGALTATINGKDRMLTVGARTAGGGDRYVRDETTGTVYVVRGEVTRDLESGEGALSERETHGFKDADVLSVKISASGKTREILRRGPDTKRIWADPADPDKNDETAANFIAKVDRLKPTEYLTDQPPAPPDVVVRIDYEARGAKGAFVEIARMKGTGDKPDYLIRTERTRLWAKVLATVGEQVDQDLASVIK
jgi:hypothetical protein